MSNQVESYNAGAWTAIAYMVELGSPKEDDLVQTIITMGLTPGECDPDDLDKITSAMPDLLSKAYG